MALAVTHIILTIVILDIFRHYVFGRHKFPRYLLVVGGIAGLGPDLDIPLSWIYNLFSGSLADFHGTFTHSLFWVGIFLAGAIIMHAQGKMKWAKIGYVVSAGWFSHLLLDCLYGGYKTFFWPFSVMTGFCPQWGISPYAASIDAIILVLWLAHEEIHNKIRDYI